MPEPSNNQWGWNCVCFLGDFPASTHTNCQPYGMISLTFFCQVHKVPNVLKVQRIQKLQKVQKVQKVRKVHFLPVSICFFQKYYPFFLSCFCFYLLPIFQLLPFSSCFFQFLPVFPVSSSLFFKFKSMSLALIALGLFAFTFSCVILNVLGQSCLLQM